MGKILTVFITVIVCTVVVVGAYFFIYKKTGAPLLQSTSPNVLYLTNPVLSFSGKIESIKENTFTVSQEMILNQAVSLQTNPNQTTKAQTKKITYQVLVTEKTMIIQSTNNVPYLLKQTTSLASPSATSNKLTNKDLKTGQYITVTSNTDLRTLLGNQFEANYISITPNIFSIIGKINKINGNEISVLGTANPAAFPTSTNLQASKEKEYTIIIDQNTEISGSIATNNPTIPSKPEKYSLSDLKKDLQVMIYAEGDVNSNQKTTALRVSPLFITNLPLTQLLQSSSPAQSTKSGTQKPK
ncbi:MAG: hypothetical protein WCV81_05260 [Microgenomates group bacterium]|jgi:hypothetical protein